LYEFFVPGVLLMTIRTYPVGTADAMNGQPPDLNLVAEEFTSQAVTPLTDKTARYFYIMGQKPRNGETQYDLANTERAFVEDKTMIEAQQQNIDVTPEWRFTPTTADQGILAFNRLVEKLAREESIPARQVRSAVSQHTPEITSPNSIGQ
jgi:hypothetical protein